MRFYRQFGYCENKPAMFLRTKVGEVKNVVVIKLEDAWKYSEDHNDLFIPFITARLQQICGIFGLVIPKSNNLFTKMMSELAGVIMEGLDELVKMPPEELKKPNIEDMALKINGVQA